MLYSIIFLANLQLIYQKGHFMLFNTFSQSHTPSQTQLAYDYLLEKILSCEYMPGQEISEKMLNEELSFGRTPIREALVTLKSQNLITVYPRKGMQIRPFTQKYINDIYQIRKIMEPNIIIQFKNSYSKNKILKLQNELETMNDTDDATFYKKDIEFHMYFIEMTKNESLISFYETLMIETYRLAMYAAIHKFSSRQENIPQHSNIICALMTENDIQIANAINEHINYSLVTLLNAINSIPNTN